MNTISQFELPATPVFSMGVKNRTHRMNLRESTIKQHKERRVTIPIPFSFAPSKFNTKDISPFVSLASKTRSYFNKTPQRFRTKAGPKPVHKLFTGKPTKPQEFRFYCDGLMAHPKPLSCEERENYEMLNMPKFVPLKFDEKIKNSAGDLGIPKITKNIPTQIEEFHLSTRTKKKVKIEKPVEKEKKIVKGKMPNFKTPFKPKLPKTMIVAEPFKLESEILHDEFKIEQKKQLEAQKLEDDAKRQFVARPMPAFKSPMKLRNTRPATRSNPFLLESEILHQDAVKKFKEKIEDEDKQLKRKREFKARPLPKDNQFIVRRSQKQLTTLSPFELNLEKRNTLRNDWWKQQEIKEKQLEEEKQREIEVKKKLEEEEIKILRKSMVHKALPMPNMNKKFKVKKMNFQPTEAHTPNFQTNKRKRKR